MQAHRFADLELTAGQKKKKEKLWDLKIDKYSDFHLFKVFNKEIKWCDAFQCLEGAYKKAGEELLIMAWSDSTRRNGFKTEEGRFR